MSRFVLTAQLQLQAPKNTRQVVGQIRQQLAGQAITVPIEVKGAKQAQKAVDDVGSSLKKATSASEALGRSFGQAVKRFAAFTVASRAVSLLTNSLASAVDEAIDFQREIVKISQVTGQSVKELRGLQRTITDLSTGLGVVSKDLLAVTRILSQAGFRGSELNTALSALAKSTLAPTFDDITQTAEGAVAIFRQFGQGAAALESQLGSINAVAGQFAVESGDLIGAVRRFGGVFKSAGGELNELLAIFTSVRQTTRESAESIATGLRTIFTRIQRPETIQYLRELGVELTDINGRFVGPYKAAQRLGKAFAELPQGDLKFIQIAEELGGFRQIGKVIPLLQQYKVSQEALQVAQDGSNSLAADAAKAQQALAVQITKVKEEFLALVRGFAETASFQVFTRSALALASALIKVADSIRPLLPLITGLAAFKFAKGLGGFLGGAGASIRGIGKAQGGQIQKFARGGYVPGSGNGDTVPAMLTPGEFVIKKSSAASLGSSTLEAMNNNKFADGGVVNVENPHKYGAIVSSGSTKPIGEKSEQLTGSALRYINKIVRSKASNEPSDKDLKEYASTLTAKEQRGNNLTLPSKSTKPLTKSQVKLGTKSRASLIEGFKKNKFKPTKGSELDYKIRGPFPIVGVGNDGSVDGGLGKEFEGGAKTALDKGTQSIFDSLSHIFEGTPFKFEDKKSFKKQDVFKGAQGALEGYLLEGVIGSLGDLKVGSSDSSSGIRADFDFESFDKGSKDSLSKLFDKDSDISRLERVDAKRNRAAATRNEGRLVNKIAKDLKVGDFDITKKASGGSIGGSGSGDTVPALLTPGEFVVNKKSAQSIGYGNLNSMNKSGVSRFAKGGSVGVQRFAGGGAAKSGGLSFLPDLNLATGTITALAVALPTAQAAIEKLGDKSEEASNGMFKATVAAEQLFSGVTQLLVIGVAFSKAKAGLDNWGKAVDDGTNTVIDNSKAQSDSANKAKASSSDSDGSSPSSGSGDDATSSTPPQQGVTLKQNADFESKRSVSIEKQVVDKEDILAADNKRLATLTKIEGLEEGLAKKSKIQNKLGAAQSRLGEKDALTTGIEFKTGEIERIKKSQASAAAAGRDPNSSQGLKLAEKLKEAEKELAPLEKELEKFGTTVKELEQFSEDAKNQIDQLTVEMTQSEKETKKAKSQLKQLGSELDETGREMKKAGNANKKSSDRTIRANTAANQAAKRAAASQSKLNKAQKHAVIAANKAAEAEKKLSKQRRKASFRAGTAKGLRGGAKALAGGAAISAIVSSLDGYTQQLAERAEKKQRDAGNVEGSAKVAEAGVLSSGIAELFSLPGLIDIAFSSGLSGFFEKLKKRQETAGARSAVETADLNIKEITKNISSDKKSNVRDVSGELKAGKATLLLAQSATEARNELKDLKEGSKERKKLEEKLNAGLKISLGALIQQGVSLNQAESSARKLAGGNKELEKELLQTARASINLREAMKEVARANLDSLKITSAFGAASSAVDAFSAGLNTGASSLGGYIAQLESSRKNVGVDVGGAIDAIEKELTSNPGASDGLKGALRGQADVARASSSFSRDVGGSVSNVDLSRGNAGQAKKQFKKALSDAIPADASEEVKRSLRRVIDTNVDAIKPEDIATTDISEVVKKVAADSQKLSEGFFEAGKIQDSHNAKMSNLYKQREALEKKAAEALNKAIDTQLEAAQAFEDFGGARLTGDQKTSARAAQFNNVGAAAGVSLGGGGAGDIRRVAAELANVFNSQQNTAMQDIIGRSGDSGRAGSFSGGAGVGEDKRDEAKLANQALITFTKQRIGLLKEELTLVQAKNREEKSALDKLISGDIEGFIKGQAAAGAGAALSSGSSSLAGLFSGSALGAGFKSLQGQGLSDDKMNRAAGLTLGNFGITDPNAAGVLSGTTGEAKSIKAEGRDLSRTLGDLAGAAAQMEVSEIAIKDATIIATNVTFQSKLNEVSGRNSRTRRGGMEGGPLGPTSYFSNGAFVPRGTDTVPAMLTPGEFVVNRSAVKRGNNLQMLKAMNSSGNGGASSATHMSGGGRVYYQHGGMAEGGGGGGNMFLEALPALRNVFADFSNAVDRLANTNFHVKLDTTNVNVNFNGGSFLASMKDDIKRELLEEVKREIGNAKPDSDGKLVPRKVVL